MSYNGVDILRISAEYDRRAREIPEDFYSWGKPSNLLMHEQTLRSCIRLLQRSSMFPLNSRRVADIGCGVGTWLLEFIQWAVDPAELRGIDLMPQRLARARRRLPRAGRPPGRPS